MREQSEVEQACTKLSGQSGPRVQLDAQYVLLLTQVLSNLCELRLAAVILRHLQKWTETDIQSDTYISAETDRHVQTEWTTARQAGAGSCACGPPTDSAATGTAAAAAARRPYCHPRQTSPSQQCQHQDRCRRRLGCARVCRTAAARSQRAAVQTIASCAHRERHERKTATDKTIHVPKKWCSVLHIIHPSHPVCPPQAPAATTRAAAV